MTRYLLLILFVAMLGGRALGLEMSLAPGVSVKNGLLYLAAVATAIQAAVARDRKLELLPVITPFAVLCLYAAFTWLTIVLVLESPGYQPRLPFIRLKSVLVDQLLMLLVYFYGTVKLKDAVWLAKALVWVIILGGLLTVVDTYNIPNLGIITTRHDGRVEGILGNAQEFGAAMAFFLPAAVALWLVETGARRRFALFGVVLTGIGVLMSASRGAAVGVIIGSALAAYHLRRSISARNIIVALVAAGGLVFLVVMALLATEFGDVLVARMTHGMDTGSAQTLTSGRIVIWGSALREMMDHPISFLTGFGWDSYYQFGGHRWATHSVYVGHLYNLGLIGLALFVKPFLSSMAIARRAVPKSQSDVSRLLIGLVFGLAVWTIAMAFSDIEGAAIYVWAWTGVVLRLAMISNESAVLSGAETGAATTHVGRSRRVLAASRLQTKVATRPTSPTPSR